jgi:hypothetical protein
MDSHSGANPVSRNEAEGGLKMRPALNDAIWSILEQQVPIELQSMPVEMAMEIISDIQQGRKPEMEDASGGFGFGPDAMAEHVVLGVHVALAIVHSAMLLKHHRSESEMLDRLNQIAGILDKKIELTDSIIEKLKALDPP